MLPKLRSYIKLDVAGKIFKSVDNGTSWTNITPLPTPNTTNGRIEIAVSPDNKNIVYAICSGDNGAIIWFKKTIDGGANWTTLPIPKAYNFSTPCVYNSNYGVDFANNSIGWYALTMAVQPGSDSKTIIAGSLNLVKSTDGGFTWDYFSTNDVYCPGGFGDPGFPVAHVDHHAIVFRPNNPNQAIFANDGGIYYSNQVTPTLFTSLAPRNKNLNITQFYAFTIHPTSGSNYYLAGSQDNGVQQFTTSGINSTSTAVGGDGAYCFIKTSNPLKQIGSNQKGTYTKPLTSYL